MKKYLQLLRVKHYIKNLLIFVPLICSGTISLKSNNINSLLVFLAFCMVSSSVYIFNDIFDLEKDRKHERKCKRPIASGEVTIKSSIVILIILLIIASICMLFIHSLTGVILILLYIVINILYTIFLKHIPILDVACVSSGFLIRLMCGASVTNIEISNWLYLLVIVFSLYLSFGKRKNELKYSDKDVRSVLSNYTVGFFDKTMTLCLSMTNVFYALWTMDSSTVRLYGTKNMIWTVPVVLLITIRYSLDVENQHDGDPVEIVLHDKLLLAIVFVYVVTMAIILYS